MSDADRFQTTAYLNGIWKHLTKGVSKSRNVSIAKLNEYADSMITFATPGDYIKMKLIDKLLYTDQVKGEIKKRLGINADDEIRQVSLADLSTIDEEKKGEEIAVYYAYGDIVDAQVAGAFSNKDVIVGKDVCKDIEKLMKDDNVKAVVIRVNSGGGSAFASEQMWHQIMELKKVKPVVQSTEATGSEANLQQRKAEQPITPVLYTFNGQVQDVSGHPLIGASIIVKGSSKARAMTDLEGKFVLKSESPNPILIISCIGYDAIEKRIENRHNQLFVLKESLYELEDVFVTALGINRSRTALNYNVKQMNGEDLNKVKTTNFANALVGRAAGISVNESAAVLLKL